MPFSHRNIKSTNDGLRPVVVVVRVVIESSIHPSLPQSSFYSEGPMPPLRSKAEEYRRRLERPTAEGETIWPYWC